MLERKFGYQDLIVKESFKALVKKGCDPELLRQCMAHARALEGLYPAIEVGKLRTLAGRIDLVLQGFDELMPSRLIPLVDDNEPGTLKLVPISGDFHVSGDLRRELIRKAGVCRHIVEYARTGQIPRRDDLRQLAHVWPALYVEQATGSFIYALVAQLLQDARFEGNMTESSLSRSMRKVRSKFSSCLHMMLPALKFWNITAEIGRVVDAAEDENPGAQSRTERSQVRSSERDSS